MSERSEFKIPYYDIQVIISNAKNQCAFQTLPMRVSGREMDGHDPAHIAMIEQVAAYLNGKGLLNTFVKIDYDIKK